MAITRAAGRFQKIEFDTMAASMSPKGLVHPNGGQIYVRGGLGGSSGYGIRCTFIYTYTYIYICSILARNHGITPYPFRLPSRPNACRCGDEGARQRHIASITMVQTLHIGALYRALYVWPNIVVHRFNYLYRDSI